MTQPSLEVRVNPISLGGICPPIILESLLEQHDRFLVLEYLPIDFGHDQQELANRMQHLIVLAESNGYRCKVETGLLSASLEKRGSHE